MNKLLLVPIVSLAATACQTDIPLFHRMTEAELYAYNLERPLERQVVCTMEADTSTYIRKTKCRTIRQIIDHNEAAIMALDVMDFGRNYNAGLGRRD